MENILSKKLKFAFLKSWQNYKTALPILLGVLLLLNLLSSIFNGQYQRLFTGDYLKDTIIGALAGSISFGMPLTSYVIGGELHKEGVSLLAVTAFIMTWSTVGILMLPWEAANLGFKFALIRNIINFIFAIIISILTVILL